MGSIVYLILCVIVAWFGRRRGRFYTITAWSLFDIKQQSDLGTVDGSIGLTVDIPNRE